MELSRQESDQARTKRNMKDDILYAQERVYALLPTSGRVLVRYAGDRRSCDRGAAGLQASSNERVDITLSDIFVLPAAIVTEAGSRGDG